MKHTPHLTIYPSLDGLAQGLAEKFHATLALVHEPISIVIAGGRTPRLLYERIATLDTDRKPSWERVHVFWSDERCVPPSHAESNYRMAYDTLLSKIAIPEGNIHRIRGEEPPENEALRYEREIRSTLSVPDGGIPVFDIVILGVTEEGHTASVFPASFTSVSSKQVCAVTQHPVTGQQRITLLPQVFLHARRLGFIITGHSKAKILRNVLDDKDGITPAGAIVHQHPTVEVITDTEAAALL